VLLMGLALCRADAQRGAGLDAPLGDWGRFTAPVFGTSEAGVYAGAELFAGPHKVGTGYFDGVLPNGRIVTPAGDSVQVGMNPLAVAITPDGRYVITSNDDERGGAFGSRPGLVSLQNPVNQGGYSITVIDASTLQIVSQVNTGGRFFLGLQVTGQGPYRVWASGGADQDVKCFEVSAQGMIAQKKPVSIPIAPFTHANPKAGFVSNYSVAPGYDKTVFPSPASSTSPAAFAAGARISFPAGSALSPDGRFLYVACNGDESLAVIDTASLGVVKQVEVGYFPYGVVVSQDGSKILVSNWGMTEYTFHGPVYDPATGGLLSLKPGGANVPAGFAVPKTSARGDNPKTSSVSVITVPGGDGAQAKRLTALYEGAPLDALEQVGDTHPSALAVVRGHGVEVAYVAKTDDDRLGLIRLDTDRRLHDFDLSLLPLRVKGGHRVLGAYPDAIAVAPDQRRVYVAEAGINAVAVLDTSDPTAPHLLGRIPTGWYPAGLVVSPDGQTLYIVNAKGIGEDVNPKAGLDLPSHPTGVESFEDSNDLFGSLQRVRLADLTFEPHRGQAEPGRDGGNSRVLANNVTIQPTAGLDSSVVPLGRKPSAKIKHVFFILQENKSFDSMLGNRDDHFGPYASLTYANADGTAFPDRQNTGVSINTQLLATTFASGVNYYSDAEESDAGHQFCAAGTANDYTEKTLLVKTGRGLLVNKNMEPEDYPAGGYLFNNAARHGVSFKDYGDLIRIDGTDTGASTPTVRNDPPSGKVGYPQLQPDRMTVSDPLVNAGDVDSPTRGMGQSYFMDLPDLAVLGSNNRNGEPHLDQDFPGYNFNISDQRRAREFMRDFDRMAQRGTVPQYLHIYLPNDHTGSVQAPNKGDVGVVPLQQIADGDVALGMVVEHILRSPIYYDPKTGEGSAIFITYDDAQSSKDHIHPHRTPLIVVSPYAKPGYVAKRHYVSASIVKTEELLLGLPPNNYGDLFATDLRDLFQPDYNHIGADALKFTRTVAYTPSPEGRRIWKLASSLDTSAPDRDSERLGQLSRLSAHADELRRAAETTGRLSEPSYRADQERLYEEAQRLVSSAPDPE
jgi:YVTN family beta-propeller protein